MASPYTGSPTGPAHTPSAAPAPSVAPTINVPADTDPNNVATMFQQQYETLADFIAYDQDILNGQPAYNSQASAAFNLSSDLPQIALKDGGGHAKTTFDHLGYPLGHRSLQFKEDWIGYISTLSASVTPITAFPRWGMQVSGAVTLSMSQPTSTYPTPMMVLACGAANGSYCSLFTANQPLYLRSDTSAVLEADVMITSTSGLWKLAIGFDQSVPFTSSTDYNALFTASSGSANWQVQTQNGVGANTTTADSTVALATNTIVSLRVELHGSATPYGACARFFVNGVLKNTIATNIPAGQAMYLAMSFNSFDTTGGRFFQVGGVSCVINRFASSPGL